MSGNDQPTTNEEEYFVFAVPEGLEDDEELIFSVLPLEQGLAILDAEQESI